MGKTFRVRSGGLYKKPRGEAVEMTAGTVRAGLVSLTAEDGAVYFCAKDRALGALFGDRVLAQPLGGDRAAVKRVIARANEVMLGVLGVGRHHASFDPFERRLPRWIRVDGAPEDFSEGGVARDGDIVRARVVRWEDGGGLLVRVEERIGSLERTGAALDALVESAGLPARFDEDALRQADACRPASLEDDPSREDLRGTTLFTIDGWDAKDFDDAVSLEPLEGGGALLGVHIADVGSYVPQGSPLDRAAFARGTSVYFPGRVLPMLPEALSNGVCSLRPDEDKYALSALMRVSDAGEVTGLRVARTLIRSRARLVYGDVNAMFSGDPEQTARMEALGVREALLRMRALSRKLRARRASRGAIDFELDEPEFTLDERGEPTDMRLRARGDAERMIEDFMLAANEQVAKLARSRGLPILYRVHEQPDPEKLADFADFMEALGLSAKGLRGRPAPGALRDALEATRERPEYPAVATLALRSMQKATYDPKPLGHYGLALRDYCHFTSPIRRYPDLVVSRALTAMLAGERAPLTGDALEAAARQSALRERAAADAERLADRMTAARYMAGRVGETYTGRISGVQEYGFYVALGNGAEGVVYSASLDDWFEADAHRVTLRGERTGRTFSLGQEVEVRVAEVELAAGVVKLELAGEGAPRARDAVPSAGAKAGKKAKPAKQGGKGASGRKKGKAAGRRGKKR